MAAIARPERGPKVRFANEADTLWAMLDYYRATLVSKCAELSDEDLRRRAIPPSNLTLIGLLRHMADVEVYWFGYVVAGDEVTYTYDPEMTNADFDDVESSVGEDVAAVFLESVSRAKEWAAGHDLDTVCARARDGESLNLRYVVVHLIEEYARHCGHADLLREVIDGEVGD